MIRRFSVITPSYYLMCLGSMMVSLMPSLYPCVSSPDTDEEITAPPRSVVYTHIQIQHAYPDKELEQEFEDLLVHLQQLCKKNAPSSPSGHTAPPTSPSDTHNSATSHSAPLENVQTQQISLPVAAPLTHTEKIQYILRKNDTCFGWVAEGLKRSNLAHLAQKTTPSLSFLQKSDCKDILRALYDIRLQELIKDSWITDEARKNIALYSSVYGLECEHDMRPELFFTTRMLVQDTPVSMQCLGDLHGDVYTLCRHIAKLIEEGYLEKNLCISPQHPEFHITFTGDFTDRGRYGIETLVIAAALGILNPTKVHFVRGNHEDITVNGRYKKQCGPDDFCGELLQKFGKKSMRKFINLCDALYKTFPVALFVGAPCTHPDSLEPHYVYTLLCHGCANMMHNPLPLMEYNPESRIVHEHLTQTSSQNARIAWKHQRSKLIKHHGSSPTTTLKGLYSSTAWKHIVNRIEAPLKASGSYAPYQWDDIEPDKTIEFIHVAPSGRPRITQQAWHTYKRLWQTIPTTKKLTCSLIFLIRAHQHSTDDSLSPYLYGGSVHNGLCCSAHTWSPPRADASHTLYTPTETTTITLPVGTDSIFGRVRAQHCQDRSFLACMERFILTCTPHATHPFSYSTQDSWVDSKLLLRFEAYVPKPPLSVTKHEQSMDA